MVPAPALAAADPRGRLLCERSIVAVFQLRIMALERGRQHNCYIRAATADTRFCGQRDKVLAVRSCRVAV